MQNRLNRFCEISEATPCQARHGGDHGQNPTETWRMSVKTDITSQLAKRGISGPETDIHIGQLPGDARREETGLARDRRGEELMR